jgi:hypothetical protein
MASSAAIAGEESPETRPELSPRVVGALRRSDFPEEGIESVRNGAHTMFGAVGMGFDFLSRFVNTAFNTPSWPEKAATLLGPYKYFDCFLPQILGAPPQPPPTTLLPTHLACKCTFAAGGSTPSSDGTSTSVCLTVRKRTHIETDDEGV